MNDKKILFGALAVLALLITVFAIPVSASGNGTYPPPNSGDWIVGNETHVWNEAIVLNGNLIINSTGNLTLNNITLKMNCTTDGEYHIEVQSGGALYINNSIITAVNPYCFWVRDGAVFEMKNSEMHECGYSLIRDNMKAGLWIDADNTVIENNTISNNFIGIYLLSANNVIKNNTLQPNTAYGIFLSSSNGNKITNNTISTNILNGISLESSSDNIIRDNMIERNTKNGIYLSTSNNNIIISNTFISNNEVGIELWQACNDNLIADNNASNNNDYGIRIYAHGDRNVIVNNTLTSNGKYGIFLYQCDNNTVSNNSATYNYKCGLCLHESMNNRINGNYLSNNDYGLSLLSNSNKNEITKNFVSFNKMEGITMQFASSNNTLSLNNASFNNNGITSYSPNTIVNNTANSNSFCGIWLYGCENSLIGNNASNNEYGIILESGANYNKIINNTVNSNEYNGIEVESNNNTLDNNTANSNKDGFFIDGENNILSDNYAKSNGKSGFFISGENNTIYNNMADSNPDGLFISSSNNTAYDNMATLNEHGIFLSYSINNQIMNNTVKDNKYGIYLSKSNNNTLINNIISDNHYGIEIIDAKNNMIGNNNALDNYCGIDLYLSDNNTIVDNRISATWGIILDQQRDNIIKNNIDIATNKTLGAIFGKILAMGITIVNTTVTSGDVCIVDASATIEKGKVDITTPKSETAESLYNKANTTKEIIIDIGKNSTFVLAVENLMVSDCSVSADIIEIVLNNAPFMFVNPVIGVFTINFDTKLNGTFTPEGDFTLTSEVPETVNISKSIGIIVNETQVVVVHATLSNTSDVIKVPVQITVNGTWFEEVAKGNLSNIKIFKINDTTGELVAVKECVIVNQTDDTITFGAAFSNFSVFALIAQPAVTDVGPAVARGGAGGGGSAYALPNTLTIPIANRGINIFNFEWLDLDITEVSIDLKRMSIDAKVTVKEIEKPAEIPDPAGIVYRYFEITTNILSDIVASGNINFKVDKSWISSNDLDASTVTLNRYTSKWEIQPTTKISEDSNYIYCSAKTSGFSMFVITGKQKEVISAAIEPTPAPTVKATPYPTTIPVAKQPEKEVNIMIIIGIITIVLLIGSSIYYFIRKKR